MSAQIRLCLPTEILLHHVYGADPACVEEETSSCSIMACSRGQRSNRLQIESGRGSEEGSRHSSLQHSQEEPSAERLRALWTEINKRMRRQERRWPAGKKETRATYLKRLRLTALRLPKAFINKSISNMRVGCKRLLAARGRHFEEGGE